MSKKRALAVFCTAAILASSLAMPVSAKGVDDNATVPLTIGVQPYWQIADEAYLEFDVSGGSASAELLFEIPSGATATLSLKIEERPRGGSWKSVKSTTSVTRPEISYSAKSGYEYRASAKLTLKLNGKSEVITLNKGPYTA